MMGTKLLAAGGVRSTHQDQLPPYMALELPSAAGLEQIQALTPRVMRWSDELWLFDLSVCESYWHAQAALHGTDVVTLIRNLVQGFGMPTMRAALADHPWQALMLVSHMRERRLTGLVTSSGSFGQSLFKDIAWDVWWTCADVLVSHLDQAGRKRFNQPLYLRQKAQMQRAVKRLGLSTPWQLREATPLAIKRRFGALAHDLWAWAYDSEPRPLEFPWQSFQPAEKPRISRHLDFALCEWEHIEPLLREDLDRLSALASWQAGERVVSLEWRLVFHDLSHHAVPIRFRHPHSLHLERGCHGTALLQALYSFQDSVPRLDHKTRDVESSPVLPVISWELVIEERLTLASYSVGLFGDQSSFTGQQEIALLALENKLPIRLEAYDLRQDWLPEDSYQDREVTSRQAQLESVPSLIALAQRRPLFLYRKPQLFDSQGGSSVWQFCERTMAKWWAHAQRNLQRDYYRLTDKDQRSFWVFKDTLGQWFIHGVFA